MFQIVHFGCNDMLIYMANAKMLITWRHKIADGTVNLWQVAPIFYPASIYYTKMKPHPRWHPWASCQIHKIAGCAYTGIAGNIFLTTDLHRGTCVTHMPWYMLGSLTSRLLWSQWRRMRSRDSRRLRNVKFYVSGERSIIAFINKQLVGWRVISIPRGSILPP